MEKYKEINEKIKEVVLRNPETRSCAKTIDDYNQLFSKFTKNREEIFNWTETYFGLSREPAPGLNGNRGIWVKRYSLSKNNLRNIANFAFSTNLLSKEYLKMLYIRLSRDDKKQILQAQAEAKEFLKEIEKYSDLYENYIENYTKFQQIVFKSIEDFCDNNEKLVEEAIKEATTNNSEDFSAYRYFCIVDIVKSGSLNLEQAVYSFGHRLAKEIAEADEIKKEDDEPELE